MSQTTIIDDFTQILSELDGKLGSLSKLLLEEQVALSQQASEDVENIAQQKIQLTQQIELAEQKRLTLCEQLQIEPDKKALQHWLKDKPAPLKKTIAKLWQRIAYLGQKCATQNQLNGILVNHQERHAREALAVLRGAVAGQEQYSEKGAHDNKTSTHVIAKA